MRKLFFLIMVLALSIPTAASAQSNYFGDGSDGDEVITGNIELPVPNKNGPYDGDMMVKKYNSLTIEAGATLTTDQPCRGLLIYVKGDAVINGTLSMTARGAYADPTVPGASDNSAVSPTGLRYPVLISGETETLSAPDLAGCGNDAVTAVSIQPGINANGKVFVIERQGAAGGAGGYRSGTGYQGHALGSVGSNGSEGQSGGGAGGGVFLGSTGTVTGGSGSAGTCFSGGTGGGGVSSDGGSGTGNDGNSYGGSGGSGLKVSGGATFGACGGSGNPTGVAAGYCFTGGGGQDGSGGTVILIVGGNLNGSGTIASNGSQASAAGLYSAAGGGSGGGNIVVLYAGSFSETLTVTADGVTNIGDGIPDYRYAMPGGNGSIQIAQIDAPTSIADSDNDGLLDDWEQHYFGNLDQGADDDPDNDKVSNLDEQTNGTDPNSAADSDNDGLPDDWEVHYGLNPTLDDSGEDPDGDGGTNLEEYQQGSDPTKYDIITEVSNYFGDGSDGDAVITTDTFLEVPNKAGLYDGDMVVKKYSSLTINEGATLTTDQSGRGLLIYVKNDAVINGTLSMTARGAYAEPTTTGASDNAAVSETGLRYPALVSGETETLSAPDFAGCGNDAVTAVSSQPGINANGKVFVIERQGAAGGAGGYRSGTGYQGHAVGAAGSDGAVGQSGGGAGGGVFLGSTGTVIGGSGSAGTCFSGGSGGGGVGSDGGSGTGNDGAAGGGAGGAGLKVSGGSTIGACGGNGNPTGAGAGNCWSGGGGGQDGSGGTIILIVGGNLSGTGTISSRGSQAGAAGLYSAAGGGSGGGNIVILHGGTFGETLNVTADGVTNTGDGVPDYRYSMPGGNGSVQIARIDFEDVDGDRLPDYWEMKHFTNLVQNPNGDFDLDGYTNYLEYKTASNPSDSSDRPTPGIFYEYDALGRIKKIYRIPAK